MGRKRTSDRSGCGQLDGQAMVARVTHRLDTSPNRRPQGRVARYFSHGVGRDGEEIPVYAEWLWPLWTVPVAVLALACCLLVASFARVLRTDVAIWDWDWAAVVAALPLLAAISASGALGAFLIVIGFWPITRRDVGRLLEEQVDRWSLQRLDEEISREGAAWRSGSKRVREAHWRRLAWLYERREGLHGVPVPEHLQANFQRMSTDLGA